MESDIVIRAAVTAEDVRAWDEAKAGYLVRDVFPDSDLGAPLDEAGRAYLLSEEYHSRIEAICSRGIDRAYRVFFESEGERAGFALYCTYLSEDAKCFILDFCVFPKKRNQGLGKQCFAALADRAAS